MLRWHQIGKRETKITTKSFENVKSWKKLSFKSILLKSIDRNSSKKCCKSSICACSYR